MSFRTWLIVIAWWLPICGVVMGHALHEPLERIHFRIYLDLVIGLWCLLTAIALKEKK